ncbi:MAG: hypothetical protein DWI21_15490 [Planctomycetota bacterium]|nr:MAG: hypothetical protein DWI21_15490 [Planctomycetota bacterium]
MAIEITCECGKGYRVSDDKAGKRFKCRDCGTLLQVPNTNETASDNDNDDDVQMEAEQEYVPAHRRAWAMFRSKEKRARDKRSFATRKKWLFIVGSPAVVIGGLTYANARIPQVMLRIWPVVSFVLQFLLVPTILFFLGNWSCRRRIRAEIRSHDGTVTSISWQPFQGLPFTKAWGLGIHPVAGAFYSVTYIDRDGTTQHSTVGFTARGMRWDGDI